MKQLFSIRRKAGGYLISDENIDNATFVSDQDALKQLYQSIGEVLNETPAPLFSQPEAEDTILSTGDALAYAKEQGYDLSFTTLNSACERGSIIGAAKSGSGRYDRWNLPRSGFLLWFNTWKTKADRKAKS